MVFPANAAVAAAAAAAAAADAAAAAATAFLVALQHMLFRRGLQMLRLFRHDTFSL